MQDYGLFKTKNYVLDKNNRWEVWQLLKDNMASIKTNPGVKVFEINRIGGLYLGRAYYHEVDQYYNCVGFEIEYTMQFDFEDKPTKNIGFYSVWCGKSHPCAPVTFEYGYGELGKNYQFDNGCGDHVEILECLVPADEINDYINKHTFNKGDKVILTGGFAKTIGETDTVLAVYERNGRDPACVILEKYGSFSPKNLEKIL
jgi:hypothetical protein